MPAVPVIARLEVVPPKVVQEPEITRLIVKVFVPILNLPNDCVKEPDTVIFCN